MRRSLRAAGSVAIALAVVVGVALAAPPFAWAVDGTPADSDDVSVSVTIPAASSAPADPPADPPAGPPVAAPGAGLGGTPGGGPPSSPPGPPVVKPGPAASAAPGRIEGEYFQPGDPLVFSADGYTPGEKVQLVVYSTPVVLGSVVADATGSITATVELSAEFPPGIHTIEATGWQSGAVSSMQFVVVGPSVASGGFDGPTQRTVMLVIVIVGLLFTAIALMLRRRLSPALAIGQPAR